MNPVKSKRVNKLKAALIKAWKEKEYRYLIEKANKELRRVKEILNNNITISNKKKDLIV